MGLLLLILVVLLMGDVYDALTSPRSPAQVL